MRQFVAGLAVLLAGCVLLPPRDTAPSGVDAGPPPFPAWVTQRATLAESGRRYELVRGESLAMALEIPAAAGERWVVAPLPHMLRVTGRFSAPGAPGRIPQFPGSLWQVFVFEAIESGAGVVGFERVGDLPQGDKVAPVFLHIDVRP